MKIVPSLCHDATAWKTSNLSFMTTTQSTNWGRPVRNNFVVIIIMLSWALAVLHSLFLDAVYKPWLLQIDRYTKESTLLLLFLSSVKIKCELRYEFSTKIGSPLLDKCRHFENNSLAGNSTSSISFHSLTRRLLRRLICLQCLPRWTFAWVAGFASFNNSVSRTQNLLFPSVSVNKW
jgi:hypothetical protein